MTQYIKMYAEDLEVFGACGVIDPPDFMGVVDSEPPPEVGVVFRPWQKERLSFRDRPTTTSELYWPSESDDPVWVETASLVDLKIAKNAEINAARLIANRTSFVFSNKAIACDELSRSDIDAVNGIIALVGTMPPNWVGGWKAIDNTYVVISDKATWISFYSSMVQQGTTNFNHAQTLKSQLAAATTAEEVAAISWD